jgi:hypothetical protein
MSKTKAKRPALGLKDCSGAGRWPHCRWSVSIAAEKQPYEQHPSLAIVAQSKLASIPIDVPETDAEPKREPRELKLARMSRGLRFRFEQRRLLRH